MNRENNLCNDEDDNEAGDNNEEEEVDEDTKLATELAELVLTEYLQQLGVVIRWATARVLLRRDVGRASDLGSALSLARDALDVAEALPAVCKPQGLQKLLHSF